MFAFLSPKLWAAVALAVALAVSHGFAYKSGRAAVRAQWDAEKVLQLEAAVKAVEAARVIEAGWQTKLTGAQNAAITRTKTLQTSVDIARGHADSLQRDNANLTASLPHLTRDAVNRYALASSAVFDQCVRKYIGVAKDADAIGSERQTLIEAWPR